MSFSYDLSTDVGTVRRNIADNKDAILEPGVGVRWDGSNLTDDEIQSFIDDYTTIEEATAYALLSLASEYASKATTLQMGSIREEMENVSTELRRQSNVWFAKDQEKRREAGASTNPSSGFSGYTAVGVAF